MGNVAGGDVSLTIRQVEESDSGTYGCRVEIPGWFNDHKHQMTLTVVAGENRRDKWVSEENKKCISTLEKFTLKVYFNKV